MIRRKAALVGIAAGAIAVLTIPSALAATPTYHITAGSKTSGTQSYTGTTKKITFIDKNSGLHLGCKSGTAAGKVKLGKKVAAAKAGTIAKTTWKTCTGPLNTQLAPSQKGTWYINGNGKTKSGVTPVYVSHVKAVVKQKGAASNCTFTVSGSADGKYTNSTHKLALSPGVHKLKVSHVIGGCYTLINNGDRVTFKATYTLTGKIKIRSN
jgi:hypothetical protein